MKPIAFTKTSGRGAVGAIAVAVLGLFVAACANNTRPVSEGEYSARILGLWQGTVGDSRETMSFDSDGAFVCQLHPTGFIANTLSQAVTGKISGTWNITGTRVTLTVTGAQNERWVNRTASSTIVSFEENKLS